MASAGSLQRTSGDVSTLRHVKIVDCATTNVPFYPFKGRGRQKGFPKLELRRVDELKNHIKDSQCPSFLITFSLGYQTANKRKASRSPTLMSHFIFIVGLRGCGITRLCANGHKILTHPPKLGNSAFILHIITRLPTKKNNFIVNVFTA